MDERLLESAARRLTAEESRDSTAAGKGGKDPSPDWQRIKSRYKLNVTGVIKDLDQSIKDEDKKMAAYSFQRLLDELTLLSKFFGMTELTPKLKTVLKEAFDE